MLTSMKKIIAGFSVAAVAVLFQGNLTAGYDCPMSSSKADCSKKAECSKTKMAECSKKTSSECSSGELVGIWKTENAQASLTFWGNGTFSLNQALEGQPATAMSGKYTVEKDEIVLTMVSQGAQLTPKSLRYKFNASPSKIVLSKTDAPHDKDTGDFLGTWKYADEISLETATEISKIKG